MAGEVDLPVLRVTQDSTLDEHLDGFFSCRQSLPLDLQPVIRSLTKSSLNTPRKLLESTLPAARAAAKTTSPDKVQSVWLTISRHFAPSQTTASSLLLLHTAEGRLATDALARLRSSRRRFISSGCPQLNKLLGGGFARGFVTELVGEAGSGKTQLCLQALLHAQCGPSDADGEQQGTAVYVNSDGFPSRRFLQMEQAYKARHGQLAGHDFGSGVCLESAESLEALWDVLVRRLPILLKVCSTVSLLIIDSLASLCRVEYGVHQIAERASALWKIASQLKQLASQSNLAVIVVNQVSDAFKADDFSSSDSSSEMPTFLEGRKPALGLAWAHCINQRISLYKLGSFRSVSSSASSASSSSSSSVSSASLDVGGGAKRGRSHRDDGLEADDDALSGGKRTSSYTTNVRMMSIEFSPMVAQQTCEFEICDEGVFGLQIVDRRLVST